MARQPNFKYDDEVLGKFGEDDFEKYATENGYEYFNARNDEMCQLADVDFISAKQFTIVNKTVNGFTKKGLLYHRDKDDRDITKIEVKTDTRSYETRNVIYEFISHDFAGCMGECKADYVYYVFVNVTDNKEIVKKEVWYIDLSKWREYVRIHFFGHGKYETFYDVERKWGIRTINQNENDDRIANFLCNIEKLEEHGIAERIF